MVKKLKKRICFIATVDFAINAFLLNHLKSLSNYYEIIVIANTNDEIFLKKQGLGIRVIPIKISRKINLLNDLLCLVKLIWIFFKESPRSIQSITPKAGFLSMLAGFFTAVPFRVHTFTGQVWANKTGIKRSLLKLIDSLIGNLSTINIVDSHSQRDFLVAKNVLSAKKSIVFGSGSVSGVDLSKFKPSKKNRCEVMRDLSIPKDAFIFLYLGRLNRDKGVLDLASAFSKIRNDKAYLLVVGPDEADFGNQMQKLCGPNQERMRLVGFSKEPQKYLAAADVLSLPSYREGFGSVIIEAAAMGVPAIASNIYGISDAVQNEKTGLLHAPKDIDAIINCMNLFLSDSKLLRRYGSAAKKRAQKEFDADLMSQHWLNFYLKHLY
jgi:glycosyltransferase involved in cell wall biosynthesis